MKLLSKIPSKHSAPATSDVRHRARELAVTAKDAATSASTAAALAAQVARARARRAATQSPSPAEVYADVRGSRAAETVAAVVGAVLPVVSAAVADAAKRRSVQRAVVLAPKAAKVARLSPQLRTISIAASVVGLALSARKLRAKRKLVAEERAARRAGAKLPAERHHAADVARMDDEGPQPGVHVDGPATLHPVGSDGTVTGAR